jgi:AcrR family transcriptional regulator
VRVGHREQLLAAAQRLLELKGYAHITARDLVAESDTNLASIGYHFGSKAGLLSEAFAVVMQQWSEQLSEVAMAEPDIAPLERGRIAWTTMVDGLPAKRPLLLSFVEALAQADRDPELRERLAANYRQARTRVAVLVARSFGELTPDDPRCLAMASFVIAVCDGLAMQFLLAPEELPASADLDQALGMALQASILAASATAPAGHSERDQA